MLRVFLAIWLLMPALAWAQSRDYPGGGGVSSWNDLTDIPEDFADGIDDEGEGGADATAIHDDTGGEIAGITDKATPVAADHLLIEDSAAANAKKDITIGALETALELFLDLEDLDGELEEGQAATEFTRDTEWDTAAEVETAWGSVNVLLETEIDGSSELAALMDDETGSGAACFATSPTFTTSISVGTAGVSFTDDADGAITLLGRGNGNDENLTLNLDDTADTVVISSSTSLATANFSGIALQESGQGVINASDTLAALSATSSAQLASVISDESGTGALLLQDTPTLITPVIPDLSGANHTHEDAPGGGTLDGDALAGSGIAGRSLVLTAGTPDTLDADAELYTDDDCYTLRVAAGIDHSTDDIDTIFRTTMARTATRIWCETDTGTATINLQRDDGSAANMATAALVCDTSGEDACSSGCSTTLVAAEDNLSIGDRVDLEITGAASTPVRLSVCLTTTKDD